MSNKKITDLTELTTPTTDDVFPIVDIATNTTQKVQVGNLPIQTAVTTALATKQATLVSGTNIKTLNSVSLLGSGDIVLTASPSGVAGAIQFSNGSAFASDATNLFWDDTNNRLGVGTNAPTAKVFIQGTEVQTSGTHLQIQGTGTGGFSFADSYATTYYSMYPSGVLAANRTYANYIINSSASGNDTAFNSTSALNLQIGGVNKLGASNNGINIIDRLTVNSGSVDTSARAVIKGSGSTSATTSLLVQNSAGNTSLNVNDDQKITGFSAAQLRFRIGPGEQGFSTRDSDVAFGLIDAGNNSACLRFLILGTGSSYIDGYTEGAAKAQNYPLFIGSRVNNANTLVVGSTTQENGTQTVFGYAVNEASSLVTINSTTRGFLPPRMTTTQKNAIATPAAGLVVYDSTTNKLCCYNGSTWNDLF